MNLYFIGYTLTHTDTHTSDKTYLAHYVVKASNTSTRSKNGHTLKPCQEVFSPIQSRRIVRPFWSGPHWLDVWKNCAAYLNTSPKRHGHRQNMMRMNFGGVYCHVHEEKSCSTEPATFGLSHPISLQLNGIVLDLFSTFWRVDFGWPRALGSILVVSI